MKPSLIVWDLETVPDLAGFRTANDLVGKSDVDVREAIGDRFPKHIYHSIVEASERNLADFLNARLNPWISR
jgi:predicted PolB exonuclease-like 3'-5' exonuclease